MDLARTRKPFLPLLGERAGVRADFFILTSLFGFMERAGCEADVRLRGGISFFGHGFYKTVGKPAPYGFATDMPFHF